MFLVIAIALAILFIYSTLPNNVFPLNCNMYNTFLCVDAILTNTTVAGQSQLLVVFADQVPGVINVSSFQPTLDYKAASNSICTPSVAQSGQRIYCVATFDNGAVPGRIYSGTLKLYSNYCANAAGNTTYTSCPSNSNYSYGGFIRIEASTLPKDELPLSASNFSITINNTQNGGAIPAHFDVPISFSPKNSTLATHERPDLGNIRFYYGSKELYSWCESNCSTSASGNAIFWVRIPEAIPPLSSKRNVMTLQMYLLPITTEYDGIYAGEAPQLSPLYAEYDNGAEVFKGYWNFKGTSAPPGFTFLSGSGASYNNGVTLSATTDIYYSTTTYDPADYMLEGYVTSTSAAWGGLIYSTTASPGGSYGLNTGYAAGESGVQQIYSADAGSEIYVNGVSIVYPAVYGIYWGATGTATEYTNYNSPLAASTTDEPSLTNSYVGLGAWGSGTITVDWLRLRPYPPNGIMPTVTIT